MEEQKENTPSSELYNIYIDSSIEQDALINNLIKYFPVGENGWGSFYGRTGINRIDFDFIVAILQDKLNKINPENLKPALKENCMEKIVFITLWCVRLCKDAKDASLVFNTPEGQVRLFVRYTLEHILGEDYFEKRIKEAFAWSPFENSPNKEFLKTDDLII